MVDLSNFIYLNETDGVTIIILNLVIVTRITGKWQVHPNNMAVLSFPSVSTCSATCGSYEALIITTIVKRFGVEYSSQEQEHCTVKKITTWMVIDSNTARKNSSNEFRNDWTKSQV